MSTLYEYIKALCEERGVKPGKMCVELGISKSLMTSLKNGRTKSISAENAQKIANYFNVSVDHLLSGGRTANSVTSLSQGILIFKSITPQGFTSPSFAELDTDVYNVVYQDSSVAIAVEKGGKVSEDELNSLIAVYSQKEKAPTDSGEREVTKEDIKFALFGGDTEITDAMYDEVLRFAQMVKLREEAEKKKE